MDHVVLVLFENRSFDNLLGRLYQPGEVPAFDGVIGKDLRNPIPAWAEHGASSAPSLTTSQRAWTRPTPTPARSTRTRTPSCSTSSTRPTASGTRPRWWRRSTRLSPGQAPTMDGFVADYISFFTVEMGRQPTFEEYRQIMTGYAPEQVPVLSAIARGFGVFDHWFSEVPSQTLDEPLVLDGGDLLGIRRESPDDELHAPQPGRDDLRPPRAARQDLEGLRARARARSPSPG
jgi:phospholipase C